MPKQTENERITSPEKLDGYLRVIRPSMWIAFVAVLAAMAAIFVWALFGHTSITIRDRGYVSEHTVMCVIESARARYLKEGQEMKVGGETTTIKAIMRADETINMNEDGDSSNEYFYIYGNCEKNDGSYDVSIRVDGIAPILFLFG